VGRRLGFPEAAILHNPPQSVLISIERPLHGAAEGSGIEVRPMQGMAHILGVSPCKPAFADIGATEVGPDELPCGWRAAVMLQ